MGAQAARLRATALVEAVDRCPQGRKKTLHLNRYLKEKGTWEPLTSSSWETTGLAPWNIKSHETRVRRGISGPTSR